MKNPSTQIVDGLRECNLCGKIKPLNLFQVERNGIRSRCKRCVADKTTRWYQENRDLQRERVRERTYGLTAEQYEEMKESQDGRCKICRRPPPSIGRIQSLHVDHCHVSGHIRGLLCSQCNTAIGLVGESKEVLQRMIEYLESNI